MFIIVMMSGFFIGLFKNSNEICVNPWKCYVLFAKYVEVIHCW